MGIGWIGYMNRVYKIVRIGKIEKNPAWIIRVIYWEE